MIPVEQKQAANQALNTVGTWEPWQVVLIFIPIVLLVGYFLYLKYGRKSSVSSPTNGVKAAIDGIKTELKEVLLSLREIRDRQDDAIDRLSRIEKESSANDANHEARIVAIERETFQ